MMHSRFRSSRGVTLLEIALILFILFVLAAILYPVFAKSRTHDHHSSCSSNLKQVGLALIQYVQDNDERFPPAIGQIRLSDGKEYEQQWGLTREVTAGGKQEQIPGILDGYVRNNRIFVCPSIPEPNSGSSYLYSDLAANESQKDMPRPSNSIVTAESEDRLRNVGHAKSSSSTGDEAVLVPNTTGRAPKLLVGAAIGDASLRHTGGGNYGFADGHVKWMKLEDVFFPPRTSDSSSHREAGTGKLLGPDPAGATQSDRTYQGKFYKATFHLR